MVAGSLVMVAVPGATWSGSLVVLMAFLHVAGLTAIVRERLTLRPGASQREVSACRSVCDPVAFRRAVDRAPAPLPARLEGLPPGPLRATVSAGTVGQHFAVPCRALVVWRGPRFVSRLALADDLLVGVLVTGPLTGAVVVAVRQERQDAHRGLG